MIDFKSLLILVLLGVCVVEKVSSERSFKIDYENNQFLKDGQPFRYISGSMHYFRVPKIYWKDRFAKMLAAGLNAVQTYVEWSQHEPYPGMYNFDDILDLVGFVNLAQKMGLDVILRAGPYIDAERDMGGFPFWLLQANPEMILRSYDKSYLKYMDNWFGKLLPMMKPLLYNNGGPIIAIQVENEYGSYVACDFNYMIHMRDLFRHHLGDDVVLFTTDGGSDSYLKCGKTQGLYATVDFGPGTNVTEAFNAQRNHEPRGPLVNSEYYPGWMDHWAYPHEAPDVNAVIKTLDEILSVNASVNMYMFHGGTNFGFTNGANEAGTFQVIPTSYDYNAPLSEAGDPTQKYFEIRKLLSKHTGKTPGPVPPPVPKYKYGTVQLNALGSLFDYASLVSTSYPVISTEYPVTFEELGQAYGFVLYETVITGVHMDPVALKLSGLGDRAYIFVDLIPVGILNRQDSLQVLPLTVVSGQILSILVENQGRVCFGSGINDFKGLLSNVTLGDMILTNWKIRQMPFNSSNVFHKTIKQMHENKNYAMQMARLNNGPGIYSGNFVVLNDSSHPMDTFVKLDGWYKGVVFVNNFNLGRYWPIVGPQITLYLPKSMLKPYPEKNEIVVLELQRTPCIEGGNQIHDAEKQPSCSIELIDTAIIDGPTPHQSKLSEKKLIKFGPRVI